ncbi:hypothetical protein [Haloglomus halophilum]|uniref:hypothetical protein n=1 Tax=Haloglomus halophilum TaxID=2962672 RepID=UPI0020C9A73F|nr:hypothetical protein [Haloglomus halophilum]
MSKDIPMASHLLASKMFGVSARKLAESMGPPLIVPIILYTIGLPLIVTAPFVLLGGIVGYAIYIKTPPGQRPLRYAAALARHFRGRTGYVWKPPEPGEHDIAYHEPFEGWITGRPTPAGEDVDETDDSAEMDADTDASADAGPDADWPVATAMTNGDLHD